ncbi:hypothetical protein [Saccharopolyspora hattusasensis]|uniref:hypothetical protein n=1 Tax=Saccharopolyspora hattusasensis TaxID=1128679 RepID=UPI003D97A2F6
MLLSAATFVAPASAASPVAGEKPRILTYQCQGQTPLGPVNGFAYQDIARAIAPASVNANQSFSIVIEPARNSIPLHIDHRRVYSVRNIELKVPLPTNSTYLSHRLRDGYNTGPVKVSVSGGYLVFRIPGPIRAGIPFKLPTLILNVQAGPAANGPVKTTLDGSPGTSLLTFDAKVRGRIITANVPTSCYPNPNQVLTSTAVR